MRKLQKRELEFNGAITAFLALIFMLMFSLVGALVQSASLQMTKNRKRADMVLALENIFAEYDKDMLEEYNLFVRNGCSNTILTERLAFYGMGDVSHSVTKMQRLTDYNGAPFCEQAILYAKKWLGMDANMPSTGYENYSEKYLEEEELVHMDIQELLSQDQNSLPEEGNPIASVQRLKNTDLITLVHPNPEEISTRSVKVNELPSGRELKKGNWGNKISAQATDKVFLVAYLTEHFGNVSHIKDTHALFYEQEYLLGGQSNDRENLRYVCKKILSIRMASNYTYLLTDTTKQAEAEALALALCTLLTVPGITEVVKHGILLSWAYGESVVDVRVLLKGNKVPMIKSAETWQLSLSNLIKLGTDEEVVSEQNAGGGLDYQSYLTGLLLMENKETLSMRSLDLIESSLQINTDECMTKLEVKSETTLRRGLKDSFTTSFEYQ